jgi:hypothetical protein
MKINQLILFLLLSLGLSTILIGCDYNHPQDVLTTAKGFPTETLHPTKTEVSPILEEPGPSPVVKTTPFLDIEILQTNLVSDTLSNAVVVGLIKNNSDRIVENLLVEVGVFDADGTVLLSEKIPTLLNTLAPGELSPFLFRTFKDIQGVDHITSRLFDYRIGNVERGELEIRGAHVEIDDHNAVHITGELYNGSFDPIFISSLAASITDANGSLMAADIQSASSQYLEPGENGPFRVTILGLKTEAKNIFDPAIYIDAQVVPPQGFFDLTLHGPFAYNEDPGSFHLVGEITNNSPESVNVCLIAGIYNSKGYVLDTSTVNLPVSSISPDETLPFDFDLWGPMSFKKTIQVEADRFSVQWEPCKNTRDIKQYVNLENKLITQQFKADQGLFSGEIINNSGFDVLSAVVIVSLQNITTGEINAMDYANIHQEIKPGGSIQYEIKLSVPQDINIADTEVVIIAKGEFSD